MHYTCIACITIDSVINIDKKIIRKFIYPQVYKVQKMQLSRFIDTELKSDSEPLDSEKLRARVDNELVTKLEKFGPNKDFE